MRLLTSFVLVIAVAALCSTGSASVFQSGYFPPNYYGFSTGDFNSDGGVNVEDLALWKSGFGQPALHGTLITNGDANADSVIDGADFLKWQRGAAHSSTSSMTPLMPASTNVPEPSTAVLAGAALAWMIGLHRRLR